MGTKLSDPSDISSGVYGSETRAEVFRLRSCGCSLRAISRETGVSLWAIQRWLKDPRGPRTKRSACFACDGSLPSEPSRYVYLLGQYLGDGYINQEPRTYKLRIAACLDYPNIAEEIVEAIHSVRGRSPGRVYPSESQRLVNLVSFWNHWPCVFPQHGPGMKHTRRIVLVPWQQQLVDENPWPLIRGLIHSDGWRGVNRVVVKGTTYSYPRYIFSNESTDILGILAAALNRAGVAWRYSRPDCISVARRAAVSLMDEHVGPKT